jgi:hypothetical protein
MSNLAAAQKLLDYGLSEMKGVVYLDELDRQMVLLRKGKKVVKLAESGLAWGERFTFYDQVHTTGMDIKQAVDACAAVTLGKDMVFRDYAQGTFRMRGIGKGQTICLLVVPEIDDRIRVQVSIGSGRQVTKGRDERQYLKDVLSWLVINSMRVDGIQFSLLCEQSVANVWRKVAFGILREDRRSARKEIKTKTTETFEKATEVFRERIDLSIENSVPVATKYSDKIESLIERNRNVLTKPEDIAETTAILELIREEESRSDQIKQQMKSAASPVAKNLAAADLLDENGIQVEQSFNREQVQEQEQV